MTKWQRFKNKLTRIKDFFAEYFYYNKWYRKEIYVVNMLRWGSAENHSYYLSSHTTMQKAYRAAERETMERGGKYEYEIIISRLDSPSHYTTRLNYSRELCNLNCDDKKCNVRMHFNK